MISARIVLFIGIGVAISARADSPRPAGTPQVAVPAGAYVRFLDSPVKKDRRNITLHAYRMDQDEVTNAEYASCVKTGLCKKASIAGDDQWPVRGVSWEDASAYCKMAGRRLPTEAEWERAAFPPGPQQEGKGPLIAPKYDLCTVLVIGGHDGKACPTKPKGPAKITREDPDAKLNGYPDRADEGTSSLVYDLFGNVAEWVADWDSDFGYFDVKSAKDPSALIDPKGPESGTKRVIRGGSFSSPDGLKESSRRSAPPSAHLPDVGFRCAGD